MRKKLIIIIPIIIILGIGGYFLYNYLNTKPFYLDDKYYGSSEFMEISSDGFKELETSKSSFVLFISQAACSVSSCSEDILTQFMTKENISIYQMNFSEIDDTSIANYLEYYPSVIIFKKGKMVAYLDASKDSDTNYYENLDDFTNWFYSYVKEK